MDKRGELTVIGTGIRLGQMTQEAIGEVEAADVVYCLVADPVTLEVLKKLNTNIIKLHRHYKEGLDRFTTYEAMVEEVLAAVRSGQQICFAAYGHPGMFAYPTHEAVRRARSEGFHAVMMPGISAEDCLYADLGLDPADCGRQSYEATEFAAKGHRWDPQSLLILWQIGLVGDMDYKPKYAMPGLPYLVQKLSRVYGRNHPCIIYEASPYICCDTRAEKMTLKSLLTSQIPSLSTLVVAPMRNDGHDRGFLRAIGVSA